MSGIAYRPPSENLAIFDPSVFIAQDSPLTYDIIANNFLQFPTGQGTETIPALNVPGTSTLGVTNASNLNLTQTLNLANGASSSNIQQTTTDTLTIDNNFATSGNILFKANNSVSAEQTILTLNGDTGTTTSLPISANGGVSVGTSSLTFSDAIFTNSTISQGGGVLTFDNNKPLNGRFVFKGNNNSAVETTILTLDPDVGSSTALPIVVSNLATARSTISTSGMFCENITVPAVNTLYELGGVSLYYTGGASAFFDYQQLQLNGASAASQSTLTSTSLNFTDGTISNTLDKNNWSGNIQTVNTSANSTHYLNFSDSSGTGYGRPQKTAGISCNPSTNTVTATIFSGSSSTVALTSDDTAGTYYIPFSKTTASTGNTLFIDNVTGPLTYNANTGRLNTQIVGSDTLTGSLTSGTLAIHNTATTASLSIFTAGTTGTLSIMSSSQTTGNVLIGSTTATTGLVSVRPSLVVGRQLQTTSNTLYPPTLNTHLGYTFQTLGSGFSTTSILANTNTNLASYPFTTYGTYMFSANVFLTITSPSVERETILAISQTSVTTINTPFVDVTYSNVGFGTSYLSVSAVIQIYSGAPTIYLVCYVGGSAATVQTTNSLSHYSFTRIA